MRKKGGGRRKVAAETQQAPGGLRAMVRGKFKFLAYAPIVFRFGSYRRPRGEALHSDRPRSQGPQSPDFHWGNESLAFERRSGPRHFPCQPPDQDLLHYSGDFRAAHLCPVHQPDQAPPFQLPALSRKPASLRASILSVRPSASPSALKKRDAREATEKRAVPEPASPTSRVAREVRH